MWVPYSLAARLLVREVPLERCVLVPHAPELAFFPVGGRRRGPPEVGRKTRVARLGALEVVARAWRRRGASRAWWRLREAVTTLEDLERVTRRVLGGEQPLTVEVRKSLQNARTALCAREVRNLIL